ncbi:MAG: hypothetical protein NXY59_03875 [Aigarchaeota archaeon]|nr:hypothetical protein [Candidatus Pelearchaeum maunauluense]
MHRESYYDVGQTIVSIPLHITGFFAPYYGTGPLHTGSIGAGLVLTPGIICNALPSCERAIVVNDEYCTIRPAWLILTQLPPIRLEIRTPVPIGAGYALSACASLGAAFASNSWTTLEAAKEAHKAEVLSLTGLGDVPAIFYGNGLTVRTRPGAPRFGEVKNIPTHRKLAIITADLGRMETTSMLTKYSEKIAMYGKLAFGKFMKDPTLENFLNTSRWFASKVGFLNHNIEEALKPINSKIIGASVKKRVLFIAVDEDMAYDVASYVNDSFGNSRLFTPGGGIWMKKQFLQTIQGTGR